VVDLANRRIERFASPVGRAWRTRETIATGTLSPEAFPDLVLDVERILPAPA
jgi:hypothetical protein